MFERRLLSRRLRAMTGRLTIVAIAGGAAVLGAATMSATAVPSLSQALSMQPAHLVNRLTTIGRGSSKGSSSSSSSSICWQSENWSGYAVSTTSPASCVPASGVHYTGVSGTWTVPTVTSSGSSGRGLFGLGGSSNTYSAVWTGIDGFTNDDLIQAGTEQDVINGTAEYSAWWEILPASETTIPNFTVDPGDSITVTIKDVSGSTWSIAVTDSGGPNHTLTTPETFSTTQTYSGPGTSAEWIVEAPEVDGSIATLAHYASTAFSSATVNGSSIALQNGTGGEMVQGGGFLSSGSVVSIPSAPGPSPADNGFACAYGSTQPAAP